MSNLLYGIKDNKSFKEVYSKEELNNSNSLIDKGELDSTININLLSDAGIYICNNPTTANGYPITLSGTLEVIKTAGSDHIMQRYLVDGSNITYERHVGEELGGWVKIINSGDFAVLTGSMTLEANTSDVASSGSQKQTQLDINFPTGFNKDNCVCISFGMKTTTDKNYCYGIGGSNSVNATTGGLYKDVILGSATNATKIKLQVWQLSTTQKTVYYKIVLMKIS